MSRSCCDEGRRREHRIAGCLDVAPRRRNPSEMVEPSVVEERIRQGVTDVQHVEVTDLTGTKDHYEAVIVSPAFEGQSRVVRGLKALRKTMHFRPCTGLSDSLEGWSTIGRGVQLDGIDCLTPV